MRENDPSSRDFEIFGFSLAMGRAVTEAMMALRGRLTISARWPARSGLCLLLMACASVFSSAQQGSSDKKQPKKDAPPSTQAQQRPAAPQQSPASPAQVSSPSNSGALNSFTEDANEEREDENYLRLREEWFLGDRRLKDGSVPASLRLKAVQHVQNMIQLEKQRGLFPGGVQPATSFPGPANWTLIGPQPINSTATMNRFNGGPTIAGRIAALAVDPTNRDIVYLGAAAGGVWRSMDAGLNWTPITDNQPSLSTGSIAIDPTAASCSPAPCRIIYVGTGEANNSGDSYYGAGILKSTNGGSTWTQLGAASFVGPQSSNRTDGAAHIGALAVDPTNNQVILAGAQFVTNNTISGLYRSADGGTTWTLVPTASGAPGTAVVFDPTNTGVVYAALGYRAGTAANGVYRSADHGATWVKLPGTGANLFPTSSGVGRVDLTFFPGGSATTATLYAAVASSSGTSLLGMFKTTDSGTNWTKLINTPDACTASFGSQCAYDMIVRVDPHDVNTVFFGGSTGDADNSRVLFRSSDGGANWTSVSNGASGTKLHVDLHALAFSVPPTADRLYIGSDGGAWRSDNPAVLPVTSIDYLDLNSTLAITMYYPGHTADRSDENVGFGGSQDNGSHRYSGNLAWDVVTSGDGGYTAQDDQFPSTIYTTCQNICIFRSLVGGTVGSFGPRMTTGINLSDRVSFIAPLVHDANTSGRVYYGTFQIYLTTDSAASWSSISPDLTGGSPSTIRAIAVSPSDSNTVYVGTSAGGVATSRVQKTTNALMGAGATWSDITSAATLPTGRTVSAIGVDATNPQIAYVSYSGFSGCAVCVDSKGRVFRTTDGGVTWQDISGTGGTALPNAPVNTLIVDPDLANTIFVGTDVGVFRTADASQGAATVWTTVGTGLPNVIINSLTGRSRSRILRAATSGRSAWIIQDTNLTVPAGPFLASMHPALATAGSATIAGVVINGANLTPSSLVEWNGSSTGITPHPGTANQMTFDIDASLLASGAANDVRIFDTTQTPNLSKKLLFMVVNPVPAPVGINTINGTVGVPVALTITGASFVPGIDVIFNGFHNTNGVVSGGGTQIDITIPGSELPAPASTSVGLSNPGPGGGPASGFFPFTISAASGGAITTSPVSVNFGNQTVSTPSAVTTVTITNSGVASVTLNGATTKTGANPGDFSVVALTSGTPCSFGTTALAVGASCTFGAQFTPGASNARSATINIPNSGSPNPQTLGVSGTGTGSGAAASITATSGTPQSAAINTAFAAPLVATVKDSGNNPVSGAVVTFNAPAGGASGTFAGGVNTATTTGSGVATSVVFTANATAGGPYTVTATVGGVATPANYSLTNTAGAAASIAATSGTPQSATINAAFAAPLVATVKDAGSNPVNGVTVTFAAPASGASGAFAGGVKTATTNASGVATSAIFTANATAGGYTVTATVAGVATPANFSLTNNAGAAASVVATAGTPQGTVINTVFATQLQATVKDAGSNPVNGVTVTFAAPASGASGTFAGGLNTATTNASGVATAAAFTANGTVGPYTVTAKVAGVATPGNFSLTNNAGAASSITATSGTPQSATISTAFAAALVATVKDAGSNPVSGVTVTFAAPASGASGTFAGGVKTATTNASGVASSAVFTANASAGAYTVSATVAGVATPANFSLTNTAGAATSIIATSGGTQSVAINTAFAPLTANVKDSGGNGVSGVTVTFTAPASGASGTFAGGVNSAVTDATGLATAPTFTANSTTGTYTVNATVPGVATPAAFSLTNTAGAAASIAATSGTPQSATINAAFAAPLVATVKDAGNNPVNGVTVTFNAPASGAGGTFAGGVRTATSNSGGVATSAVFTANSAAGSYTVTATVAGVATPANFLLTNTTGPAASIVATSGTPQSAAINAPFAARLVATVMDTGSNPVSGVTVTFTAPASAASGTFAGGVNTATTNGSGVATSAIFTANATAGGPYNVAASIAGVATPANFSLTNTAGAPASVTATAGTPQGTAINTAFTTQLQATVKDAGSNLLSGVVVTFAAPATGASGTFAGGVNTATTNSSGVATAPVITANGTVGAYTVTATVAGVAAPANFSLTNNAGPATTITATAGTPQSATILTAFATLLQATVKDAGSNPVSGVTVTFAAPASGASGTFAGGVATATTNASGVATAPVFTANATAGSYTVTAKVTAVATSANFSLTNNAGSPASITAMAGTPQAATILTAFPTQLQATVKDASGNLVNGATVTFAAPASGASGTFAGGVTTATTNASGVATAAAFTANGTAGTYMVSAKVAGVAAAALFTLTNDNVQPVITTLSPASTLAGGAAFSLTINGSGFVNGASVDFGSDKGLIPSSVTATQIKVGIPAVDIAAAGSPNVVVTNPAPALAPSLAVTFTVNNPLPTIATATALGKNHISGGAGFTLTVNGTNFVATSVVNFGSKAETTTLVSATQVTAAIPAGDVATAGNVNVTVTNPPPGGGSTTAPSVFTVDGFSLSGPATPPTVKAPSQAMIQITVTPSANGFVNPVTFNVSGLPAQTSFVFNPASVTPNGAAVSTTLVITTKASSALPPSMPVDRPAPPLVRFLPVMWMAALLVGLYAMFIIRRSPERELRRHAAIVPLALLLLTGAVLAGCAGQMSGTPKGPAPLVITATSGTMSQSTNVTLTVQ